MGFFEDNDADLRYQDEIHGPIILQVDKVMELMYTKYQKALIKYEGVQRVEEFMFPYEAFRELLLNAINHKAYESKNPIQISVYNDKIYVWNDGEFPQEITAQDLFKKHPSKPYNPLVAQTFFKVGFIESWGRGFEKIKNECKESNVPMPKINIGQGGVMVKCIASNQYKSLLKRNKNQVYVPDNLMFMEDIILYLIGKEPGITQTKIAEQINVTTKTVKRRIAKLKAEGVIERVGSDRKGYWNIKYKK